MNKKQQSSQWFRLWEKVESRNILCYIGSISCNSGWKRMNTESITYIFYPPATTPDVSGQAQLLPEKFHSIFFSSIVLKTLFLRKYWFHLTKIPTKIFISKYQQAFEHKYATIHNTPLSFQSKAMWRRKFELFVYTLLRKNFTIFLFICCTKNLFLQKYQSQ